MSVAALTDVAACSQLQAIRSGLGGSYRLTADVNCSGFDSGDGHGFLPIGEDGDPFTGQFDGNGHVVTGLHIDRPQWHDVGLFGRTDGALIKRVGVAGANVVGYYSVGALVGAAVATTIQESFASGSVTGEVDTGGLVGGQYQNGAISDCYSSVTVDGGEDYGLLVGWVEGATARSYASGTSGQAILGVTSEGSFAHCFFDCQVAGGGCSVGGGVSTATMHEQSTYTAAGWDFNAKWGFATNGYPCLRWQAGCGCAPGRDSDGDGLADCQDVCDADATKTTTAGACGCSHPDVDTDGDGPLDCNEPCPFDPTKIQPGICGCNEPDVDADHDGLLNCNDPDWPRAIRDCAGLQAIRNDLAGSYRLLLDIDCSQFDDGDGLGFRPLGEVGEEPGFFTGHFDGNGHVIRGVRIERPGAPKIGLFGRADGALIERVGLVDASVHGGTAVGALVGAAFDTTIRQSYATGTVIGEGDVGGLVGGQYQGGSVTDSYASVAVDGGGDFGLLVGWIEGDVARGYASGVTDPGKLGVECDYCSEATLEHCFFDCEVSGNCSAPGGSTTSAMSSESTYTSVGWDFQNVWSFGQSTYPCLRWQHDCEQQSCAPSDATCDNVDDDCSGAKDEDYVAQSTSCGVGACARTGSTSCVSGSVHDSCTPGTPAANDATCNNVDDDCSGAKDEDYVSQSISCGNGACARTGSTSCVAGSVQNNCTPGNPSSDANCNGIDDDCDGTADDNYVSQSTSCGVGACGRTGTTSCVSGSVHDSCAPGAPAANDTTCNNVDDDCSGAKDEDYVPQSISCGTGACARTGSTSCVAGSVQSNCTPGNPSSDANCNGIDDDCDGTADDNYATQGTSCGVGACARTGATSCVAGAVHDSCVPGAPAASDASCNGVDDDCNGVKDDGFVPQATSCGVGQCRSTAMNSCVAGVLLDPCTPGIPAAHDATCDLLDDDCDGVADEEFTIGCSGDAVVSCENGALISDSCSDGNPCNGVEGCANATCTAGTPPSVDDGNPCTSDSCDPAHGVVHTTAALGTQCGNGVCSQTSCVLPATCLEWHGLAPNAPSGVYSIDIDGSAGPLAPVSVYCDMVTDGGGWQLVTTSTTNSLRPLIGTGYCQTPDPSVACAGALNPVQIATKSEILVRDMTADAWLRYGGFSASAQSALHYFTGEFQVDGQNTCSHLQHTCADTTKDPALTVAKTSGFLTDHASPLKQWWKYNGWWVGGDTGADTDVGRVHRSNHGSSDIQQRPQRTVNSSVIADGPQAIFHRVNTCSDGVRSGNETDVDCGGICDGCAPQKVCRVDNDCSTGRCDAGLCAQPEQSCAAILSAVPASQSRAYLIDVDLGGAEPPFSVYCDMKTDGGGWQLVSTVRSATNQLIVGSGYCTTPDSRVACKGHINPLQVSSGTELMINVPGTGDRIVYSGFSASSQSALRNLSRELNLDATSNCEGYGGHMCGNSTRDPGLAIARTSGYAANFAAPLKQWWRFNGFQIAADPSSTDQNGRASGTGYVAASNNIITDLRSRATTTANAALRTDWHQVLLFRNQAPAAGNCSWRGTPLPAGTPCDDGNACTGTGSCNGTGACVAGPANVDDGNVCTVDSCDPAVGPVHAPRAAGSSCSNNDVCDGAEQCQPACDLPAAGLRHQWHANGNGDDSVGTSTATLLGGATFGPGYLGNGFVFNGGAGDRVQVPHSADLNLEAQLSATAMGWFKTTVDGVIVAKHVCGTSNGWFFNTNNGCYWSGKYTGGQGLTVPVADGQFHHFACVKDNDVYREYIDGKLVGTTNDAGNNTTSTVTLQMGGIVSGSCNVGGFTGTIDEVTLLHRAVSAGELANIATCAGLASCNPGTPLPRDDGNACTADTCDPVTGVSHPPLSAGAPCNDGNVCTATESCNGAGSCVTQTPTPVDDADPCTADSCAPGVGVVHTPVAEGTACNDTNVCNGAESCTTSGPIERFLQVNPRRTYFLAGSDVLPARAIALSELGVVPGDALRLRTVGSFTNDGGAPALAAVFSTSDELLPDGKFRVTGAVSCNLPPVSAPTGLSTRDIPQDFLIPTTNVVATVPAGATHIFVSILGLNYTNSVDFDGDFGIVYAKNGPSVFGCHAGASLAVDDGNACTIDRCDPTSGVAHDPYPQGAKTCAQLGAECGAQPNGCGGTVDCGQCPAGSACGSEQPGRCGLLPLSQTARIHIGRETDVARLKYGARVVEPLDYASNEFLTHNSGQVSVGSGAQPRIFTIRLGGPEASVIHHLNFDWDNLTHGADYYEVWVAPGEDLATATFTRVAQGVPPDGLVDVTFAPTRARFVRLVLDDQSANVSWGGYIRDLHVYTRPREGGVLSLFEGGAEMVRVSSERVSGGNYYPSFSILDLPESNDDPAWYSASAADQFVVFSLVPAGKVVSQLELVTGATGARESIKDFELQLSNTGSADADFTTVLHASAIQEGGAHVFEVPPTPARFAKLRILSNYGSSFDYLQRVRLYGPDLGGAAVPFDDYTGIPEAQVASRLWTFGDGSTSTEANPQHTYASPGSYEITLTVTDTSGHVGHASTHYTVLTAPHPDFDWSPKPVYEGHFGLIETKLTDLSTATSGHEILLRHWMSPPPARWDMCGAIGCGDTDNEVYNWDALQGLKFSQSGTDTVTLEVTDTQLLTARVSKPIEALNIPPTAEAGQNVAPFWGEAVVIGANSAIDDQGAVDATALRCEWSFGDGTPVQVIQPCKPSNIPAVSHAYADPGTYTATLTVFDDVSSVSDTLVATSERHPTMVVPLTMVATAVDGVYDMPVRLFDKRNHQLPMVGFPVELSHNGQIITATTGADSIAHSLVHFDAHSYSSVSYAFAGDARYEGSTDAVDYIVREGDEAPVEADPLPSASEGTRFVLAFPQNSAYQQVSIGDRALELELSSRVHTTATVRAPSIGFSTTVAIEPDQATVVTLPDALRMGLGTSTDGAMDNGESGMLENKGFEVTSLDEVTVQAFDRIDASTDAYLGLPVNRLGQDYLVLAGYNEKWRWYSSPNGSEIGIVAPSDDTEVTIIPSADVLAGPQLPNGAHRGEPFTITLDAMQTFQIQAASVKPEEFEDFSGTRVMSSKPVAVFGGHVCTSLSSGGSACNHIIEQLPPVSTFGTRFISAPFTDYRATNFYEGAILRVLAGYDGTEVRVDGVLKAVLDRGEVFQGRSSTLGYHEIITSHPSLLGQYSIGADITETGDPTFMLVPPVDQYVDRIVLSPPRQLPGFNPMTHVIGIIAKTNEIGYVRVNGQPPTAVPWRAVGDGTYATTHIGASEQGYVITSLKRGARLMAFGYGAGRYDRYSIIGAEQIAHMSCQPSKTEPGDHIDNDCDGVEGEELANGLDDDGDGVPDEDLAVPVDPNAPNHAPVVYGGRFGGIQGTHVFALAGYDADGDPLTYRLTSQPASSWGTTTLAGALLSFTGTVPENSVSQLDWVVVANDGHVDSAPVTMSLKVAETHCLDPLWYPNHAGDCNEEPYFWGGTFASQVIKVPPGQVLQYSARATAHDWDREAVTYSLVTAPSGMTIGASTGIVSWLVDSLMAGNYTVKVRVTDGLGTYDEETATLTVLTDPDNAPPVFDSSPVALVEAGSPYSYVITAHDPEGVELSYQLLAGPSGMSLSGHTVSWNPQAADIGDHTVLLRATDVNGAAAVQRYTLTVAGSQLHYTSSPALLATAGVEYRYQPVVTREASVPELTFDFEGVNCTLGGCDVIGAERGMRLDPHTGLLLWKPDLDQLGTHEVILVATDELGNEGRQFFSIEVLEQSAVPRISSTPVTRAVVGGQYRYDVNADDLGEREVLAYTLTSAPANMTVDYVTGVISWVPPAVGSYSVSVRVTDSAGNVDDQSFVLQVEPDVQAPIVELTASTDTVPSGGNLLISARASDEVAIGSLELTVDGVQVEVDSSGHYTFSSGVAGVHTLVLTAIDTNNNASTQTLRVGVSDAADTAAPVLTLTTPSEDQELTYIHDVVGTITDANLLAYQIGLRRRGETAFRQIGSGSSVPSSHVLGKLDTTVLENGYYELQLSARDVNNLASTSVVPFRVAGSAKPGVVQLSFVDMALPMAGIPLSLVRSYDSRVKTRQEFGYGWRLDTRQGSVAHNRKVGQDFAIYSSYDDFALPCQESFEQESHFTEVRLSDRERYIFRPIVVNNEAVSGSCEGDIAFELVEGSTAGAKLYIIGGLEQTHVRAPALIRVHDPRDLPQSDLRYAFDPDGHIFDPQSMRLELADGRRFDLTVSGGITRIEDRQGNAVSINSNGITHSGGKSLYFDRDAQNRLTRVRDANGRSVQYGYDLNGDLVRVTNPIGEVTRFVYSAKFPHLLATIIGPDGKEVAALGYDAGGRLTDACDAEDNCSHSNFDLASHTLTQTDASSRPVTYHYDGRGNVTSQTDALGHTVQFEYDAQDNLLRAQGPDGSVATYTYDASGNLLTRVLPHEAGENANDFTYHYTYTARNDRQTVTLPSGGVIRYDYDTAGNLIATKDGTGNVVESRTYNTDGTLASRTDRFGTTAYGSYQAGQPTQLILPDGALVQLAYDGAGRLTSRTERGLTMTYDYDALGRPTYQNYGLRDNGNAQDGTPESCPLDSDCDGVLDATDNCPDIANPNQEDSDANQLTIPGATAVWRFEEASGNSVLDSVGSHTGTIVGGTRVSNGRHGKGIFFDGVDDGITIPDAADLKPAQLTIELWARPESLRTNGYNTGFAHGASASGPLNKGSDSYYLGFYNQRPRSHSFHTGTGDKALSGTTTVPTGSWTHLAYTFDGSTARLYRDGQSVAFASNLGALVYENVAASIGDDTDSAKLTKTLSLHGTIDDVAIYPRALTGAEIAKHATQGVYGDGMGDACDPCLGSNDPTCVPADCIDLDGDGYGIAGHSACGGGAARLDCNDGNPAVHPGAAQHCDGIDNDCDGRINEGCATDDAAVTVRYEYTPGAPGWTAIEGPTFGRVTRTFTARGKLGSWTEPNGDTSTRLYDAAGRIDEEVDPLGNHTLYGYDAAGRLQTITDATLNATTTFERDSAGRVTKTTDALGHVTRTAYKVGGRISSTTNARGFTTHFNQTPTSSTLEDALARTTVTNLTAYGLPTSTQFPGGASTSSSYLGTTRLDDAQSFPVSVHDELSRQRSFGYDARSGLRSATDLAGAAWQYSYAPAAGSAIQYDPMSGSVSLGQQDGGASAYAGGSGGDEYRDVAAVSSDGGSAFAHLLSSVTSPMGETTSFVRGQTGRIERIDYPDGGHKLISYGPDARPKTITLPQGTVVTLQYDAAGREISRTTSNGEHRSFTYGVGDRVETMTDDTGTTTYSYDAAGRFSGITYPYGGSVRYDRDVLGRTTAVKVKATATATDITSRYTYDENGNLKTVTDPLGGVTNYVYDQADRLQTRTLPNGVVTSYTYDSRDRALSIIHRGPTGNVLASVVYERAASGEPTKITREDGSYVVLTYDAALRIDTETYYNAGGAVVDANDYDYDLDGNRTGKQSLSGGYEKYTYAAGFKLASVAHGASVDTYGYDGGGRLTHVERDGTSRTLQYNSDDKVTRVVDGAQEAVRYSYDGEGRRVAKIEAGVTTRFLVAPNLGDGYVTPQTVTDGSGAVLEQFVFAGEHPIARISAGGEVEYYLQDAMGSVIGMADAAGAATATLKYDSFGKVTSAVGAAAAIPSSIGNDFRYHGMLLDASTGIYFARARSYDAATGRFLSRDPIEGLTAEPERNNPYVFVLNNPLVWRDPTGAFSLVETMTVVTTIGIIASIAIPSYVNYLNKALGFRDGDKIGGAWLNAIAGFGDGASGGTTALVRTGIEKILGLEDAVDYHSASYWSAVGAGFVASLGRQYLVAAITRTAYASTVKELGALAVRLRTRGMSYEAICELLVPVRNAIKANVRDASGSTIQTLWAEGRNLLKYGDSLGPTAEQLFAEKLSWQAVYDGLAKTSSFYDKLL